MKIFAKIVNDFQSLIIPAKNFILDAWRDSKYAYGMPTRSTTEAARKFIRKSL